MNIEVYTNDKQEMRLRVADCVVKLSAKTARVLAQQLIFNAGIAERRLLKDVKVSDVRPC